MSARPGWIVGLVALAALVYISINTLRTSGPGSTGLPAGRQIPPFAAPLVMSDLVGDANVAMRGGQAQAGPRPACQVRDPRALNVCTLARRRPVVLAFFTADAKDCVHEVDALQAAARRHPDVGFAAVAIRGDRGELRTLVRAHGWTFPVAQDHDGAVANLYGVAVCPTVVLAYRGGRVLRTAIGEQATAGAALERGVRRLLRGPLAHAA